MKTPTPLRYFSRETAHLEALLTADYLGEADIPLRVAAATASGDTLLNAVVLGDPEIRLTAFHKWRMSRFGEAMVDRMFALQFLDLDPQTKGEAGSGFMPFAEIEAKVSVAYSTRLDRESELRRGSKNALRAAVLALHVDVSAARRRGIPEAVVVLADGSVTYHAKYHGAKAHGRASNQAFWLGTFDHSRSRFHDLDPADMPDSPDTPEVVMEPAAEDVAEPVNEPEHAEVPPAPPSEPKGLEAVVTGSRARK
jgi:hypothetical protein